MSFPRYPKYKASGVEWLGDVPEHWTVIPLKWLTDQDRQIMYGIVLPGPDVGEGIPILKGGNVKPSRMNLESMARTTAEIEAPYARARLKEGDLVYSIRGTIGDCEPVPVELTDSNITQDVARVAPAQGIGASWLRWALLSSAVREDLACGSLGAAVRGINIFDLKRAAIPTPPQFEQNRIAVFLDQETEKIDELVAEQRRLMELLKEKRQAVISHSVTRGLNPDAALKPSGIEWLGDVPAHWEVKKMKWVAEMQSGHTPDKKVPTYWDEGDIPWVSLNDTGFLKENDYISETAYNISQLGVDNSSARVLPERVVVFSRDATIGRCAITTRPMAVSQHFIAWVCSSEIIPEYLLLRLRAMTQELDRLTTGATLKTIGMPDVRTLVTPVPPLSEQQAIIEWIADTSTTLDTLTGEAQRAIDLLQERRTALISAAVTGQIDVRGFAAAEAA